MCAVLGTLVTLGAPGGAEAVCEPQAPTSLVRHGQLSTALVRDAAATAIWAIGGDEKMGLGDCPAMTIQRQVRASKGSVSQCWVVRVCSSAVVSQASLSKPLKCRAYHQCLLHDGLRKLYIMLFDIALMQLLCQLRLCSFVSSQDDT